MIIFYSILMFILGALFTSFFELIADRIPKKESILGRSHCDQCHETLKWIDIIPVFGYIIRRGKCSSCEKKIPLCYPLLEFLGGLIFLLTYLYQGFSLESFIILIMYAVFYIESRSDQKHMIVIDRIWMMGTIPLIVIRIIQGSWLTYLISSTVLFAVLFLIAYISSKLYHREALGGGDVKLYFFIGWLLTLTQGFLSLFIASILGLIYGMIKVKKKSEVFALVPFIALGVIISYFYGEWLIESYLNLLGM